MFGEEELGASFLITLKHRGVTPDLVDGASQCLADLLEPIEVDSRLRVLGTEPTYTFGREVSSQDRSVKNDAFDDHGAHDDPRTASFPLSLPEDAHWLSDLQCFVRSHCCEFFVAGEVDVKTNNSAKRSASSTNSVPGSGSCRRGRVSVGRVGIRCVFCRDLPQSSRAAQSTSFPSQISGVYGAVVMMQCRHFSNCHMMPDEVRETLANIKGTRNTTPPPGSLPVEKGCGLNTPGRQQYWAESARKLGLVDTLDGIRFSYGRESDLASTFNLDQNSSDGLDASNFESIKYIDEAIDSEGQLANGGAKHKSRKHIQVTPELSSTAEPLEIPDLSLPSSLHSLMGDTVLISTEDKDLVPDYLFLAMAQMKPCSLNESDKVGCYKDREIGFTGMCCKHCGGQPGFGKYFPATVRSLAQTTTSQTIIKHIGVKCRLCPQDVRNAVLALQQSSHEKGCNYSRGPSSANDGRPKYGSRKVFFQRVWGRLHGEEVPDIPEFDTAPPTALPASAKKKHSRQEDQPVITPRDSEATEEEEVSSLDGCTDSGSVASSSTLDDSVPSTRFYSSEEESDLDDTSVLTDDKNRRIIIRAGGSQVHGRAGSSRSRRAALVLPTKNGKRKVLRAANFSSRRKRARLPQ